MSGDPPLTRPDVIEPQQALLGFLYRRS